MSNPIVDAVSGAFSGILKPILDKWIPDAKDRLEAEQAIWKAQQDVTLAQIEVNKIEAGSQSVFVAGWRPAVGWVCGGSLAYHYVIQQFLAFILEAFGNHVTLPNLDITELMIILGGMLGLGAMRSFDKTTAAK
jgi:hypothetical protein